MSLAENAIALFVSRNSGNGGGHFLSADQKKMGGSRMRKKTICAMMTGFLAVQGIEVHAEIQQTTGEAASAVESVELEAEIIENSDVTDADGKASIDTINEIGKWVSEGRGVIIDVDAGAFYNSPPNYGKGHAVTITSVEKNKYGDITAFYILDSNQGTVKYPTWEIQECMRTFVGMNVTSQIIR